MITNCHPIYMAAMKITEAPMFRIRIVIQNRAIIPKQLGVGQWPIKICQVFRHKEIFHNNLREVLL